MTHSYEQVLVDSNWLSGMPFEHAFRGVPRDHFISRLGHERALFDSQKFRRIWQITVCIVADEDLNKFQRTFESCLLQSARWFHVVVLSRDPEILSQVHHYCRDRLIESPFLEQDFKNRVSQSESIYEILKKSQVEKGYVIALRSGDVLHPSCLASIYFELNLSSGFDVCLWNEVHVAFGGDSDVRKLLRKPQLELYTLFHLNYIGETFAFRMAFLTWFQDFDICFSEHDIHYFLLSIVKKGCRSFVTIPQYLLLRDLNHIQSRSCPSEPRVGVYQEFFSNLGFTFKRSDDLLGYSLVPKRIAKKISIIIPFRDQVELTQKAVESVICQEVQSDIEIILINNQSHASSVQCILQLLDSIKSLRITARMLDYDKAFNHSAECNLGAKEALGECLLFMNNDAQLLSRNVLAEMAAWSLVSDVGTVGTRILHDREGKRLSAGIAARLVVGREFDSPVQESQDVEYAEFNRQTWGNSFACAAISKKKFESIGPLDEVNFPNGYNDVDYNMRCRKLNLVNVYLGAVCVLHRPGVSRGRCDEVHQKIMLRRKYPEILAEGLFQLALENCSNDNRPSHPMQKSTTGYLKRISRYLGI